MGERIGRQVEASSMPAETGLGKVTLFEALAQELGPDEVGVDRSNHTTQQADFDDQ